MPRLGPLLLLLLVLLRPSVSFTAEDKDRLIRTTDAQTPEQERQGFHLPEGFSIQLFADESQLGGKTPNMAFDARGRLWVSSTREYPYAVPKARWSPDTTHVKDSKDSIRILEDTDGDGHADKVTIFADELNIPTGVLPYKNGCIAWSIPNILYLEDTDGDGKCDKRSILFGPLGYERDTHGMISSLRLGLDGWVYATHGFSNTSHFEVRPENRTRVNRNDEKEKTANATPPQSQVSSFGIRHSDLSSENSGLTLDISSGSVFRFKPDGSRVELWTSGQVNPFGLCWDSWGNLYSADCHSNPISQLIRGACYPSFGKPDDGLGFAPVMCAHAHGSTGLCGIIYLDGGVWGPEWDDHMFVGNCVTSRVNHDHITFNGSTPKANEAPDFLTSDDPWFRPVDLQLGPDSALYVADFYNRIIGHYEVPLDHPGRDKDHGRIWRVVREGFTGKLGDADVTKLGDKELADLSIASSNLTRRYLTVGEANARHLSSDAIVDSISRDTIGSDIGRGKDKNAFTRRYICSRMAGEWQPDRIPTILKWLRETPVADTSLRHALSIALRNVLKQPGAYDALRGVATDEQYNELIRISSAVPTGEAANWMLEQISKGGTDHGPRPELGPAEFAGALAHMARYLPSVREGDLVSLVHKHAVDLDTQLELFAAIRDGRRSSSPTFRSRDLSPLPPGLASAPDSTSESRATDRLATWSAELTERLLAALKSEPANTWRPVTPPTEGNPNPWLPTTRKCAGGQERTFLDSHVAPGSERLTGTLRSAPFALPAKLTFWLAGHSGFPAAEPHDKNFVRLVDTETGEELARAYPPRHDVAQQVTWTFDHQEHGTGGHEHTVLELTDGDNATTYAWLAAGGFDPAVVTIPHDALQRDKRIRMLAELCSAGGLPVISEADHGQAARDTHRPAPGATAFLSGLPDKAGLTPDTRAALAEFFAAQSVDSVALLLAPLARDSDLAPVVLAALQDPQTTSDELTKAFHTLPFRTQAKLAAALAGSVRGANQLLKLAAPAVLAEPLVSSKLNALDDAKVSQRLKALTASLPPHDEALDKLIAQRLHTYDAAKADVTRGEQVFTTVCFVCHRIGVRGNLVGPQLDGIGARGIERLLEDILDPNRSVDPAFRLHLVKRMDGTLYAGLQRREEGDALVFADATAQETRIPKADIAGNEESAFSLMPPGLGEVLTEQQLDDLLAYLLARK